MDIFVDKEINACDLRCPLPILRAKKALAELSSGQILRVWATDTQAVSDFEAFCKQTGNALLEYQQIDKTFSFLIKRR